jgi:hypothetical protein
MDDPCTVADAEIYAPRSTFNLNSAYLTAGFNDGLTVEVWGYVGSTLTYDNKYTVSTYGPTLVNFNYIGVTSVGFLSYGGTPHGYSVGGTAFRMDNLSVSFPPASISAPPMSRTAETGSFADFSVGVTNAVGRPTYQWYFNGSEALTNTIQPYFDLTMWRQPNRLYRLVPVP